jgi:hypothetical protein
VLDCEALDSVISLGTRSGQKRKCRVMFIGD